MAAPSAVESLTAPGYFGLNTQDSPVDLDKRFALEATNCIIDKFGRVGSRKGWTAAHTTATDLGTNNVQAIGELTLNDGTRTVLCAGNGKLFKLSGTTLTTLTYGGGGVAPTISTNNWQMVQFNGCMLFWQRAFDCLIYDPLISTTAFRRLSEHASYLGSAPQANCALCAYGRVWAASTSSNRNTVYWSDTLSYMVWTGGSSGSLNLYGVWPNGGDEVVALAAHNDRLIIFGKRQTLIYAGANDPSTMVLEDAIGNTGCAARDSVANTPDDVIFLDFGGVTSLKRTIQEKSAPISRMSKNINDDIKGYTAATSDSGNIKSIYSAVDSFYLLTFVSAGITYCFDLRGTLPDGSNRATMWYMSPKSYAYSDSGTVRMGMPGYIGNHSGYTDNGTAYRMTYYSPWIDFGDPIRTTIAKKVVTTVFGAFNQVVTNKWGFDYLGALSQESVTLPDNNSPAEYGIAEYGIAEFGDDLIVAELTAHLTGAGKVMQVGFEADVSGRIISVQRMDIYSKHGAYK